MNLIDRVNHKIDPEGGGCPDDELERQIEWQADYYAAILAEPGNELPLTRADLEALALSEHRPTRAELARRLLHEEFLDRIRAEDAASAA